MCQVLRKATVVFDFGRLRRFKVKVALRPQRPLGLLGTGSPGRPSRLSHSSWVLIEDVQVQGRFTSTETIRTVKPVLNWANVCSPNILRTVRRTMIRFVIELLVRRTWFGQFDELYFVLNWLVMRCKLRPELAADAQQTA